MSMSVSMMLLRKLVIQNCTAGATISRIASLGIRLT